LFAGLGGVVRDCLRPRLCRACCPRRDLPERSGVRGRVLQPSGRSIRLLRDLRSVRAAGPAVRRPGRPIVPAGGRVQRGNLRPGQALITQAGRPLHASLVLRRTSPPLRACRRWFWRALCRSGPARRSLRDPHRQLVVRRWTALRLPTEPAPVRPSRRARRVLRRWAGLQSGARLLRRLPYGRHEPVCAGTLRAAVGRRWPLQLASRPGGQWPLSTARLPLRHGLRSGLAGLSPQRAVPWREVHSGP